MTGSVLTAFRGTTPPVTPYYVLARDGGECNRLSAWLVMARWKMVEGDDGVACFTSIARFPDADYRGPQLGMIGTHGAHKAALEYLLALTRHC